MVPALRVGEPESAVGDRAAMKRMRSARMP